MKHAKPRETVTAVLFLLLLAAGCIYALYPFSPARATSAPRWASSAGAN